LSKKADEISADFIQNNGCLFPVWNQDRPEAARDKNLLLGGCQIDTALFKSL